MIDIEENITCDFCKETKKSNYFAYKIKIKKCKLCYNEYRRKYRKLPHVLETEYKYLMKKHYKKAYGLSIEEYDAIIKSHNGLCAICKTDKGRFDTRTGKKQKLHIDHCHLTGKIRGLLCNKCNIGIGLFNNNIELFKKVIEYLSR